MKKEEQNPYQILLETFGEEVQYQFAIEEMGELLQAICKFKRKKATGNNQEIEKALNNLREEIADVTINMEQLSYMFGQKEIEEIKQYKIERALKRAELKNTEYTNKNED